MLNNSTITKNKQVSLFIYTSESNKSPYESAKHLEVDTAQSRFFFFPMSYNTGFEGEKWSLHYISNRGYEILFNNYRCPWGEIDLIARDSDFLVFIEVKTRKHSIQSAVSSVSKAKIRRILRTASWFLNQFPEYANCFTRFDVIALRETSGSQGYQVLHIKDAFRADSVEL